MVCLLEAWREHSSEVRVSALWGIVPADFGTGVSSSVQEIQQMTAAVPWLHTAPWQNSVTWPVFSQHGAEGNAELRISPGSSPPVQHKTCEPLPGLQRGWQITCVDLVFRALLFYRCWCLQQWCWVHSFPFLNWLLRVSIVLSSWWKGEGRLIVLVWMLGPEKGKNRCSLWLYPSSQRAFQELNCLI